MLAQLVVLVRVNVPGEAEVGDFQDEFFAEEAISCGEIAMGEATFAQIFHASRDLQAKIAKIRHFEGGHVGPAHGKDAAVGSQDFGQVAMRHVLEQ